MLVSILVRSVAPVAAMVVAVGSGCVFAPRSGAAAPGDAAAGLPDLGASEATVGSSMDRFRPGTVDPTPPVTDAACPHELKVTVRDFRGYDSAAGPRHPDFEGTFTSYTGIVQPLLGADQKPVYAPAGATPATTSAANFDQWYRDVSGVNLRFDDVVLPLTEDPARPGTFVYDNQMFFPIDGRGWMDLVFGTHNYHFTTEIHVQFPYRGGEVFSFRGDDDVFVFINGRLAIDLGGVHPAQMGAVTLDDQAAALGMERNH